MEKITAYKDKQGNVHTDKVSCEIANLMHELNYSMSNLEPLDNGTPNLPDFLKSVEKQIEVGKKHARLHKLLTGR